MAWPSEHQKIYKKLKNSTYAHAIRRLSEVEHKNNIRDESSGERDSLKMTLKMKNKQFLWLQLQVKNRLFVMFDAQT